MREVARWQRGVMSPGEGALHWTMIVLTCGFWYPVYHLRKRKLHNTVSLYEA
jgi:hypothetical protein